MTTDKLIAAPVSTALFAPVALPTTGRGPSVAGAQDAAPPAARSANWAGLPPGRLRSSSYGR